MRRLLVILASLLSVALSAQEIDNREEGTAARRTRFGISAGPSFIRFYNKAYFPTLSYHTGVFGTISFRKLDLLLATQYFPMHVDYKDANDYADFTNHVVNLMLLTRFPVALDGRLTLDVGTSFANGISHNHSDYHAPSPLADYYGVIGEPVVVKNQFFFVTGSSWKLATHNTVTLSVLFSLDTQFKIPDYTFDKQYYMLQASYSYAF